MKLSCEIVEDLLPLYEDNVCSAQSGQAVEAHLRECEKCRKLAEETRNIPALDIQPEAPRAKKAAARSFRKIRFRWGLSLLLVILLVPVCILSWNQYRGRGVYFTNLHELHIANAFMHQLQEGKYEAAFQYLDLESIREDWLENWFDEETMANIEADGLREFREAASWLEETGGIQEYQYIGIRKTPFDYRITYSVTIGGQEREVQLDVTDDGVNSIHCDGSFLEDPLAHFGMWSEYLWQYYSGCYFDPVTKEYVYYNTD